ncbi:MAG: hypothetical protein CL557_12735 [Alphaproteobacteria bacterium]|nr:hypothetical protein [Alphaproteobacteria bacterium]MBN59150.1 hypothetical protein [Oceanospirillaceae bacterium]MAJ64506.1 hypothetical protein [Alphaproteobacteria bacterium]MAS48260.1 hypothetical protein [Alphaproteobacteria bacterium]MAX96355.1 hypothetical protein [Alphaproteobacteria bacterium]
MGWIDVTNTMKPTPTQNLAAAIRARVAPLGGVELDLPVREPMPAPITDHDKDGLRPVPDGDR